LHLLGAAQFQDADKYSSYLKTTAGRLRCDLAWENLRRFLPDHPTERSVLDLGGGTGAVSVRLAKKEFHVVLLESSQEMLGVAREEAQAQGVAARIAFRRADAAHLEELFGAQSFDIVVCHNLLEYVADPAVIVQKVAGVLRNGALVSVLVRNRAGEVLKAAIKSGDWGLARASLSAETVVDSLFSKPVRVFDPKEVVDMLAWAGLHVVAQYGVRVFSDYRDATGEAAYRQLLELEMILGAQPKFADIARYTQLIARPSSTSQSKGAEP
jgi:S-adenosylmethionine-dependent methyltransferase